jgi:hypothetical protein
MNEQKKGEFFCFIEKIRYVHQLVLIRKIVVCVCVCLKDLQEIRPSHTFASIPERFYCTMSYRFCRYARFRARVDRPGSGRTTANKSIIKLCKKKSFRYDRLGVGRNLRAKYLLKWSVLVTTVISICLSRCFRSR